MGPVTEGCGRWHGLLALEVVGQLDDDDRVALSAHLDGCPECRDQRSELSPLAHALPAADPDHLGAPAVPPALRSAVLDRLRVDGRRRKRRVGLYLGGSVAAVGIALAVVVGVAGSGSAPAPTPGHTVALEGRHGVSASARLTPEPWGTAVHLQETGQGGGQVLTVSMRSTAGSWWDAGTYRTVTGHTVRVELACGVPASRISSIWVRNAAGRTVLKGYVA